MVHNIKIGLHQIKYLIHWMFDDDEVGLKENPEDTISMKSLHQNEIQSIRSVGTLNTMDSIPNCMLILGTADLRMGRFVIP